MLGRFLEWFAVRFLELRTIWHNDEVFLRRFYLFGKMTPDHSAFWDEGQRPKQRLGFLPTTFLHCFHMPDVSPLHHNHPWNARGLILSGGYVESRYSAPPFMPGALPESRVLRPGRLQKVSAGHTFHRVAALRNGEVAWTLFATSEKKGSWGYWREGGFVPWRDVHTESNSDSNREPDDA